MRIQCAALLFVLMSGTASAQTSYYVDPDVTHGDGSAGNPWNRLWGDDNAVWSTIGAALGSGAVTVYFSAANEAGNANETCSSCTIDIENPPTSTNRLTLDGNSQYNTSDSSPSWAANPGSFRFNLTGGSWMGWSSSYGQIDNITIKGFELTGNASRILVGGDNVVVQDNYVHDNTTSSPGILVMYAASPNTGCTANVGTFTNIDILDNTVENNLGEAIYIGGNNSCPSPLGNVHDDITIDGNTITNSGVHGGEGDGIDVKAGITNVTVTNNTINGTSANGEGMTFSAVWGGATSNLVITDNNIQNVGDNGITLGTNYGVHKVVQIKRNYVSGSTEDGIALFGGTYKITDIEVWQNTLVDNGTYGVDATGVDQFDFQNNLVCDNNPSNPNFQIAVSTLTRDSGNAVNDFNYFSPDSQQANAVAIEGANNVRDATCLTKDPAAPGYPPYDPGGDLLVVSTTSLATGQVGVAYSDTVSAAGGTAPYAWDNNGAGTSLNDADPQCASLVVASSGAISGTPQAGENGVCSWTARVTDDVTDTATQALAITIDVAPVPSTRGRILIGIR